MSDTETKRSSNIPLYILIFIVLAWVGWKFLFPRGERIKKILYEYDSVPAFTLKDLSGKEISSDDLKGKIWLASFVSSRSEGIKKTMTQTYSIMRSVKMHKNVVMVSFSTDPDHDKPEVIMSLMKEFNVPPGHWHILSGEKEQVLKLMKNGFKLGYSVEKSGKGIRHSLKFILVDWKGFIRGYYDSQDNESRKKLLVAMGYLIDELENE
ncbi:MAG: SCO family protein [Spirochaetota bacterium]|nr:SCO family protein [Spirochaetota bacterium]